MKLSFKSLVIFLSLGFMLLQSGIQVFTARSRKIGNVNINQSTIIAYRNKYKNNEELIQNMVQDLMFQSKYVDSNLSVPMSLIISKAKHSKFSDLSLNDKLVLAKSEIISEKIIDYIKKIVIISDKQAYLYAKGLKQTRDGEKANIKYSDIQNLNFNEEEMKNYYENHKLEFNSDRVVKATIIISAENDMPRKDFENAINNKIELKNVKKYQIQWVNNKIISSPIKDKYEFLIKEQKEIEKFYSTSDGNILYVKIDRINPSRHISYEEAKSQVKRKLVNDTILDNINKLNLNWTKMSNITINDIGRDKAAQKLFLTKEGNYNYYVSDERIIIVHNTKIKNAEPTKNQIEEAREILKNHFVRLTYIGFINSLHISYQDDLYRRN